MNTTTRKHPRTLTEAFSDADRAQWIEAPQRSVCPWRAADLLLATVIGVLLAAAAVYGWPL